MAKANSNPYLNSDSPTLKDALKLVCDYFEGHPTSEQARAMDVVRRVDLKYFQALETRARCSGWQEVADELGVTKRIATTRFSGGLGIILVAMLEPDYIKE